MKTSPKIVSALVAGLGFLAIASSAQAQPIISTSNNYATYNLGLVTPGAGWVSEKVGDGAFSNTFTFTSAIDSAIGAQVDNLPLSLTFNTLLTDQLDITGLTVSLKDALGNILVGAASATSLYYSNLLSGSGYTLIVSGTATGADGGIYGLNYNVSSVSAVPIPAALPLFGAGLLALGAMAWGKKRREQGSRISHSMV
jgi:hypothetical protein